MQTNFKVALHLIIIAFLIAFFSWVLDNFDDQPLVENGVQVIHMGIGNKLH